MIAMVEKVTGKTIPYRIGERRLGDVAISLANPSKADKLLWWKAQYSVSDAIRDGWKFIIENR